MYSWCFYCEKSVLKRWVQIGNPSVGGGCRGAADRTQELSDVRARVSIRIQSKGPQGNGNVTERSSRRREEWRSSRD